MPATPEAIALAQAAAEAAADKLATDIMAIDVSEYLVISDVFLLCTAANDRQVKAVVDAIEERLAREGAKPIRREGEKESRWVLLDYGDVVVHVQVAEERIHYALEQRHLKGSGVLPCPVSIRPRCAAWCLRPPS